MTFVTKFTKLAAVAAAVTLLVPSADAGVLGQGHCSPCISFSGSDTLPVTARTFSFNLPAPGRVQISFHGILRCTESEDFAGGLSLSSQIVTPSESVPAFSGGGGLIHVWAFPSSGAGSDASIDFSLVSTRSINYPTGGTKVIYFRIGGTQSQFTTCVVWSGAFTVVY